MATSKKNKKSEGSAEILGETPEIPGNDSDAKAAKKAEKESAANRETAKAKAEALAKARVEKQKAVAAFIDDTNKHKKAVIDHVRVMTQALTTSVLSHDSSKFDPEEQGIYSEVLPRLKDAEYGTDEYSEAVAALGPALQHHHEHNRHHPEHFDNGCADMTLIDLIEMLADWKAAADRDGKNILDSITYCANRYNISSEVVQLLLNTVEFFKLSDS